MTDMVELIRDQIRNALKAYAAEKGVEMVEEPVVMLERPRREGQGDWASNVAMQLAKTFRANPREIAQNIVDRLSLEDGYLERAEVAGPGFINFFFSRKWAAEVLAEVSKGGDDYGRVEDGKGRRVQVEFVSANPTGPLHVGHGRGAAVGDVVASILAFAGWDVEREYYVNDAGLQMGLLGKSTQARYFEILGQPEKAPMIEDGYKGEYIYDLARDIIDRDGEKHLDVPPGESLSVFQDYAEKTIRGWIKDVLSDFGVEFNVWFSEQSLYDNNQVEPAAQFLKERDKAYEKDGALWFRSTEYGDDKDRVLFRSNGVPTYFMSDIAYHKNKFDRGFDLVIDVWGADHHGYVPRVRAAVGAMGRNPQDFQVLLIQFVSLLRGGEQVSMSTRSGQFITLKDVLDEVGRDATRYFFIMRSCDSHLDFDLELAKQSTNENPVYYVQYAHARIHSIFREASERGISIPEPADADLTLLGEPSEQALIRKLAMFPEEISKAAQEWAPHRLTFYVHDLASLFHSFYNAQRILGVEEDVMKARLVLVEATRQVLANSLRLMGISAPEKM